MPSAPKLNGFSQLKQASYCPFDKGWRLPWDMINLDNLYKMNYHVTISPDPLHSEDFYDRKYANKVFRQFLNELKKNNLYSNIISVYEYGPRGKKYGKLHWHILFRTSKVRKIETISNTFFGTTPKRCKATTVVKRIRIDKNYVARSDKDKIANYHKQVEFIMNNYMKKEQHNKHKCLYTDMIPKNN
ncbi:hypothetical protein [Candidatus Izimaplasma sp. ZiA1]|uniref:hypothetical protein n=1 Tax=Candidatus Izimoplasma sp. ZiA1 TaxID=2024899 RepID=UPI00143CAD36